MASITSKTRYQTYSTNSTQSMPSTYLPISNKSSSYSPPIQYPKIGLIITSCLTHLILNPHPTTLTTFLQYLKWYLTNILEHQMNCNNLSLTTIGLHWNHWIITMVRNRYCNLWAICTIRLWIMLYGKEILRQDIGLI